MKNIKTLLLLLFLGCLFVLPTNAKAASLFSSIEVEGIGEISLAKTSHTLGFETSLDYVNITATPASEGVTIEGAGKINITEGMNQIVVTATNGSATESQTINLNVSKISGGASVSGNAYGKGEVENPETGAFFNYTLIVLCIAGAIGILKLANNKNKFFRI